MRPGTPAASILKPGDVIVAVDGKPINIETQAVDAIHAHKPGDRVTFSVARGGAASQTLETTLTSQDGQAFLGVVLDSIAEETGVPAKLSTSGGTSDARFIKSYCPVLEFGPSNATIHQVDERIAIEELRALSRIYRAIIEKYFLGEDA